MGREDDSNADVTLVDYTDAFQVDRTIRKIGKVYIPIREGLRVSDLKVFGVALLVWAMAWSIVLNPVLRALIRPLGWSTPTGWPYLAILVLPPVVIALASRKPVKHNLRMLTAMRIWALDQLDDPIHYRGQPVRPENKSSKHYLELWEADPKTLPGQGLTALLPSGWGGLVQPGEHQPTPYTTDPPPAAEPTPDEPDSVNPNASPLEAAAADIHLHSPSDDDVLVIRARRD